MSLFQPGQPKTGGRAKGVRNKLSGAFLNDVLDEWAAGGKEALRIARIEDPVRFTVMVASLLPKELEISHNPIIDISDDDLDRHIEYAQRQLEQRARSIEDGEGPTANGRPAPLLLSVSETT